ncbi:MAG: lytic murein transglycosylase, partial [Pseudomonadota bacterium]
MLAAALAAASCAAADLPSQLPNNFPVTPAPEPTSGGGSSGGETPSVGPFASSGNFEFDAWRDEFAAEAVASGEDPTIVRSVLTGLSPIELATAAAFDQPEFTKPIWDYVKSATAPSRVSGGKEKLAATPDLFTAIETVHGPPREILAAIWGMETSYGKILGSFDAPRALANLAYKGRRTKLGEDQLIATMKLIDSGAVTREDLKRASWAGAMGQTQFMPSTFLAYAVDWDGDNRKDLWDSEADALASAANYLAESGWRRNEPWAVEVVIPE